MKRISMFSRSTLFLGLFVGVFAQPKMAHAKPKQAPTQSQAYQAPDQSVPSAVGKVNLLTATEDRLALLPGVGPSLAARVVKVRTEHADAIQACQDLGKIKGFSANKVEGILPFCCVSASDSKTCANTLEVKIGKDGQPSKHGSGKSKVAKLF